MDFKAKSIVARYVNDVLGVKGQAVVVNITWSCYILGNRKWLLCTNLQDNLYFEVTYDKSKEKFYLDVYEKKHNEAIDVSIA